MKNEAIQQTPANIDRIRTNLMSRKQELEEVLTQLYKEKFSDGQVQDFGDQSLSSTMETLQASIQDSRLNEYKRILAALKMIDGGTYGICADCGHAVSPKRLKAYPNAIRCITCQEIHEEETGA